MAPSKRSESAIFVFEGVMKGGQNDGVRYKPRLLQEKKLKNSVIC